MEKKIDFAILGPSTLNQKLDNSTDLNSNFYEVDTVKGHAMFLNMEKIKKIGFFDENFFLYFEEIDLCKRIKKNNEKIYIDDSVKIKHYGGQSINKIYNFEIELTRNWHWMWSTFYFTKKHKGFLYALFNVSNKLISAFIKYIFYSLTMKSSKKLIYKNRMSGLFNSIMGKSSWYRPFNNN